MEQIRIISVNISEKKGIVKSPVDQIVLNDDGIVGDAHAGQWHRQISLLGTDSIEKMQSATGGEYHFGAFAENITATGYPLYKMRPLDRLIGNEVHLEVTQIGKKCHGERCAIYKQTGDCIMPREGIFCRVIHGGALKAGDILEYKPKTIAIRIITVSDRASKGLYEDKSGPLLGTLVEGFFTEAGRKTAIGYSIVPDEAQELKMMVQKCVHEPADIIFTTGGTGIGPRDISPDVIGPMFDKEIPGIMEMIRVKYGMQFPNALVSRSMAGVIGRSLVFVLPGSPKAVNEYAGEIIRTLEHAILMLHGIDKHS